MHKMFVVNVIRQPYAVENNMWGLKGHVLCDGNDYLPGTRSSSNEEAHLCDLLDGNHGHQAY